MSAEHPRGAAGEPSAPNPGRAPGAPRHAESGDGGSLERVLATLERHDASAGFTARLLARVRDTPRRPERRLGGRSWLGPSLVAGALAGAAVAGFLLAPERLRERRPSGAEGVVAASATGDAELLRRELRDLEHQLVELERMAAERQPLIAVEGDHADYLIDLRDFLPTTGRAAGLRTDVGSVAVPAGYRTGDGRSGRDGSRR